ncbi:TetR/AcrR family transcriptional regulator [Silvibacterium sp.]|uniref:TetR/AcrR family transcriptional regulator n=1 Tax=Silvibacterium sp. TaxID=1964179 RepID=UPI0039E494FC
MAHRTISDEAFFDKALDLFRTYGVEGVSLQQLAEATGLEKASLYYRYPGGKEEIVLAVAQGVVAWLQQNVVEPLAGDQPARKRIAIVAEHLRTFYGGGKKSCVTEMLSIPGGPEALKAGLRGAMQAWIKAFADVARESGLSPAAARARAEEAVIRIEGSLIVARVLGDIAPFERTIKLLPDLLTANA